MKKRFNKKKSITFVDAQQMHNDHPTTFEVPEQFELDSLKPGDQIKISDGDERFWVKIISKIGDKITAQVNNHLVFSQLKLGDIIKIETKNIYSIYE